MRGISFDARLLDYVDEIRQNGWGRRRALRRIQQDHPYVTEAEVRRLLRWMHRNPLDALEHTDVDEVAEAAVESHMASRFRLYEARKQDRLLRDAERWNQFEQSVRNLLRELPQQPPRGPVPERGTPDPFILVTSATDFHWGMYAWKGESYQPYDRAEARRRLLEHTKRILSRCGTPEKIVLAVGSDFYHVDGDKLQTTRGTQMDAEGTPLEILVTGLDVQIEQIELLRRVAPVEIVQMVGNHDRSNGFTTLLVLHAWAKNQPDVTVHLDFHPRAYLEYGQTLLAFSHGDGAPIPRLASAMSTEAREQWGRTKYHVAFGGHLHHQLVKEDAGITYLQLRSLAGSDRYHTRHGWVSSHAGLDAYIVDKEHGVVGAVWSAE